MAQTANTFLNNARPSFGQAFLPRPLFRYNDPGYTIGGPIMIPKVFEKWQHKAFFFFSQEWQKQLSPNVYDITRNADTEMAFTGKYWDNHDQGLYRCTCCGNALFDSATKFDSGTGWPSFWQPIAAENVSETHDTTFGIRNAVSCTECDAHLGHVFDDGPQPTGLRYCMNSASLRFVKRT